MKRYNNTQLREILERVISKGLKHKHYDRTVALAKYYTQIRTGNDHAELIYQYKPRESDNQKEQRVAIYNSRTQSISNKTVSVFKRVPRSDNIVDNMYYMKEAAENAKRIEEIQSRFKNFHHGDTMKDYLTEAFEHYSFYDPNAWLLIEMRIDDVKEKPFVYPVEITSAQAIYYEWYNSELQYLVVKQTTDVNERDKSIKTNEADKHKIAPDIERAVDQYMAFKSRVGDKFLLYAGDFALEYTELPKTKELSLSEEIFTDGVVVELKIGNDKKRFLAREYNTKSQICPVKQFGYIKDPETNRETYVAPDHAANHIYRDLINKKSEYDLVMALHGFLQKIQYAPICDYQTEYENNTDRCMDGKLSISHGTCPQCSGLGLKIHRTSQDIILIKWPEAKEEFIPLDQAIHYVDVPEHMVKTWRDEVSQLGKDVSLAVFNTQLFDREEIAVTATEKRLNTEAAYDVLFDYGSQLSAFFIFITKMAAIHTMNDEGLIIEHKISSFQLDTIIDLLAQRRLALDAGSPYAIVQAFDMMILSKLAQDAPVNVEWVKVRDRFRPFREKSKEELMSILADKPDDYPKKVLYENFEDIMDEIEFTDKNFLKKDLLQQRAIVDAFVAKIIIDKNKGKGAAEVIDPNDPQAKLRGSVGGVTGLVSVAQAVAEGTMTEAAAETILKEIYGLDPTIASRIVDIPQIREQAQKAAAKKGEIKPIVPGAKPPVKPVPVE